MDKPTTWIFLYLVSIYSDSLFCVWMNFSFDIYLSKPWKVWVVFNPPPPPPPFYNSLLVPWEITPHLHRFILFNKKYSVHHMESMHITKFYTQLKKLGDELDYLKPLSSCVCTNYTCQLSQKFIKIQQDQRLMIFLMKLTN